MFGKLMTMFVKANWILPGQLVACRYPAPNDLRALAAQGVSLIINLEHKQHDPALLQSLKLDELHLPVADFTAPTQQQLQQGVSAIQRALAEGRIVAVHCRGGMGRTGTLIAAYLVRQGISADEAIAQVRAARPGSVETREQEAAVAEFENNRTA